MISNYSESNVKRIIAFFRAKGIPDFGIFGLIGNLYAESRLRPDNLQNSGNTKLGLTDAEYVAAVDSGKINFVDNRGFGLAQWTSAGRKQRLLDYCKTCKTSIADLDMQLGYLWWELNNGYTNVLKVLRNATSVDEAARVVIIKFERPASQGKDVPEAQRIKAQDVRVGYAQEFYDKYANTQEEVLKMGEYKKGKAVQLSKNFKSTEFDCNGKGCCSVTPIDPKLVEVLQNIRDHFGVSVNLNCGYRCEKHNAEVKGASKNSKHLTGLAADIVVKGVHPMSVARYIETIEGFAGRIGCYTWDDKGNGFVHVDVRGTNSRGIYTENNTAYDSLNTFTMTIKKGSTGRLVKVVQRKLKSAGLYSGKIDGKCGAGTVRGIIAWNAAHGRANDASWGKKCWGEAFPI